ncbi:hypothetical protein KAW65_09005 [candidate division WOR-3 bacterium]|nr:hypothetical protein [candidate division WOR-3 bacterium]
MLLVDIEKIAQIAEIEFSDIVEDTVVGMIEGIKEIYGDKKEPVPHTSHTWLGKD